jgi:hypothetical protein
VKSAPNAKVKGLHNTASKGADFNADPDRRVRSQQRRTSRQIRKTDASAFVDLLTNEDTLDLVESLLPVSRERFLPPTETLAMFMAQALNADRPCQKAINELSARP